MKNLILGILTAVLFLCFQNKTKAVAITYTVNSNAGGSAGTFNAGTGIGSGTFEHAISTLNGSSDPGPHVVNFTVTNIVVGWLGGSIALSKSNVTFNGGFNGCDPNTQIDFADQNFILTGLTDITFKGISFQGTCLLFTNGGNHKIYGCWFNLNAAGTTGAGYSKQWHIKLDNSTNCIIGRTTNCNTRNVFSGSGGSGGLYAPWGPVVYVSNGSNNTIVAGNYVGMSKDGTAVLSHANNDAGIGVSASTNVLVDSNSVGGFTGGNIFGTGTITGLKIRENYTGLGPTGLVTATNFGSKYPGIHIEAASGNNILIDKNTVCDNGRNENGGETDCGILIKGTSITGITISNNYVGVDRNLTKGGNSFAGIYVLNTISNCLITGNIVGDNGDGHPTKKSHGIATRNMTNGPTFYGNYVGITPSGGNIGNGANGIEIHTTSNFTIGGKLAGQPNFIGYNKGKSVVGDAANAGGILVTGASATGTIIGNLVTRQSNFSAATSANHGIVVENGASKVMIGGFTDAEINTINYNGTDGIFVGGSSPADYVHVRKNSIYCNNNSAGEGIQLNANAGVGNDNYPAPNIIPAQSAPTTGYLDKITGTTSASDSVYIYMTANCTATCPKQGETLLAKVKADASGNWSYTHSTTIGNKISAYAISNSACSGGYCRTSEFSTCIDNPLPVELLYFTGNQLSNNTILLKWQTTSEIDNAYFVIEKSLDGFNFSPIGRVEGNTTTAQSKNYTFLDETANGGLVYYRLKQADLNGKFEYSNVIAVGKSKEKKLTIFPNPASEEVQIVVTGIQSNSTIILQILNTLGENVLASEEIGSDLYKKSINVDQLAQGVYFVIATSDGEKLISKLVVE